MPRGYRSFAGTKESSTFLGLALAEWMLPETVKAKVSDRDYTVSEVGNVADIKMHPRCGCANLIGMNEIHALTRSRQRRYVWR